MAWNYYYTLLRFNIMFGAFICSSELVGFWAGVGLNVGANYALNSLGLYRARNNVLSEKLQLTARITQGATYFLT